jgi:hypothetical protein
LAGAQQPPDEDAVTGWFRESSVSAAAACGAATVPATVKATAAALASTAIPLVLGCMPRLPPAANIG